MKTVIGIVTDPVHPKLLTLLEEKGFKFDYLPDISKEELARVISNYNYIIIRGRTRLDREVLVNASNLSVIIRYGVGLDNIDLDYAKEKGIKVYNTPSAFTEAVAELTLGLIIGLLRNIGEAHRSLVNGKWEKKRFQGFELAGKTVAILGFGRIGRRVADLLMPFDVTILAYDIIPIPDSYIEKGVKPVESIEEAIEEADIITIHMPLTKETKDLINYELLKKAKKKPFIVNTARGKIVNHDDLIRALSEGLIRGAALDVFYEEPVKDERLLKMENVLLTPHIGAQTLEAREKAAYEVIKILKREFRENI